MTPSKTKTINTDQENLPRKPLDGENMKEISEMCNSEAIPSCRRDRQFKVIVLFTSQIKAETSHFNVVAITLLQFEAQRHMNKTYANQLLLA